jgi:hypothetical protein
VPTHPVRVYSNDTLWDLRAAIGRALGFVPDIIRIFAAGRPLGPELNAKPLKELKLKAQGEMLLVKKFRPEGQRLPLTDAKGLTQQFRNAMTEIFKGYAKNKDGTMSIEDMVCATAALISAICGSGCVALCAVLIGCAVLCCAVLCCAVLCCAVLCCAVLCCAVLCFAVWCGAGVVHHCMRRRRAQRQPRAHGLDLLAVRRCGHS